MILTKKQLKEINEVNKKVKEHFPSEYYIVPDGNILGKDETGNINKKVLIKYERNIDKLVSLGSSEVFIVYPEAIHEIFSSKSKVKMGDIGEPVIRDGKVIITIALTINIQIGELVSYSDINTRVINKLIKREIDHPVTTILSSDQFKLLYDKEMVPVELEGKNGCHTLLMNRKMFKTFTHHTKNMLISVKCSDSDKRCTDGKFINDVTITHIDNKTLEPTLSISEYFMAIDIE